MFTYLSNFYNKNRDSNWFWIALIMLVCSLFMLGFPLLGVPDGYDLAQHFKFAAAYRDAISQGYLIPGWAPIDNFGYGSIGIRFYPPLADYLVAITSFITNDWYSALQINSFLWMFPGCIGVYLWVKDFRPKSHAAVAAIIYAALPYHLLEIYQYQLFSEFVASAILPFCFLFVSRLVSRGRTSDIVGLAVSCSLLILTHIPSSLIGFLGLGVYTICLLNWKEWKRVAVQLSLSAVITLSMTAFFWIRLISEINWVKHNTSAYSTGFYDPQRHLFPIIFSAGEIYWQKLWWVLDITIIFTVIAILPLLILVGCRYVFSGLELVERKRITAIATTALFSLLILSKPSALIWSTVPVLEKIQFPWRFLSLGSLLAAVSLSVSVPLLITHYRGLKRLILYPAFGIGLSLLLFNATQIIITAAPLSKETFNETVINKRQEEGCQCWWPVWAKFPALNTTDRVMTDSRKVNVSEWNPEYRVFTVGDGQSGIVRIATFYYPRWQAEVNGTPVQISPDENGAITIPIPQQQSTVRLWFQEPLLFSIAGIVSALTWLLLLFKIMFYFAAGRRQAESKEKRQEAFAT